MDKLFKSRNDVEGLEIRDWRLEIRGPISNLQSLNLNSHTPASFIPNARIEINVDQVDSQVEKNIDHRDDQHRRLHQWIVARTDRLQRQPPHARPGKDTLGDDRATKK